MHVYQVHVHPKRERVKCLNSFIILNTYMSKPNIIFIEIVKIKIIMIIIMIIMII